MRLLALQHCPVTPAGLVGERALERGTDLVALFPHDGDQVPQTMTGFDGLIILGGPMHAGDDVRYPAFAPVLSLIQWCGRSNVPVLVSVLGHNSLRGRLANAYTSSAGWKWGTHWSI